MSILCHGSTHVYRVGNLRCTCGTAANGYSPCPNDSHIFTWTSGSTRPDNQPSGYCRCGLAYYDAQEKRVTVMMFPPNVTVAPFSGYHPAGYRQPKPDPAPDVPLHVFKAARDAGASHLSADGQRIYCQRFGLVYEAEYDGEKFGAWWPVAEIAPDAVSL